jgi:hypothetical protein
VAIKGAFVCHALTPMHHSVPMQLMQSRRHLDLDLPVGSGHALQARSTRPGTQSPCMLVNTASSTLYVCRWPPVRHRHALNAPYHTATMCTLHPHSFIHARATRDARVAVNTVIAVVVFSTLARLPAHFVVCVWAQLARALCATTRSLDRASRAMHSHSRSPHLQQSLSGRLVCLIYFTVAGLAACEHE